MNTENKKENKTPWTARRVVALLGILLLIGLYASTLVFALMDSPHAKGLLMGAVFCTIAVPVLLYAMALVAKNLRGRGVPPAETQSAAEDTPDSPAATEDSSAGPTDLSSEKLPDR